MSGAIQLFDQSQHDVQIHHNTITRWGCHPGEVHLKSDNQLIATISAMIWYLQ